MERYLEREQEFEQTYVDRNLFDDKDEVLPHNMPKELLEKVKSALRKHADLSGALLARKRLKLGGEPVYVMLVVARAPWWRTDISDESRELATRVAQNLPGDADILILPFNASIYKLYKTLKKMPGALILKN